MINLNRLKKSEILWLYNHRCKHNHRYVEHLPCYERENPTHSPIQEKTGFFDIECSNLNGNFGFVISYCIKEQGGDILEYCLSPKEIRSSKFDKKLIKKMIDDLHRFDRLVVYFGTDRRFDIPFVRTRAVYHNLEFPLYKEIKATDLYSIVKAKLNLHRNRLAVACDFFDIPSKTHPMKPQLWQKAQAGDKGALDFILEHNREDVISTELLWDKLNNYANIGNRSL